MTCLKPKPNPHCFLRPTEKVFGREVLWRLETVYLVDIASDSSKQAQLEVNYLLASRSLVKCLLVSCGLVPFMRFYLVLYPIDCDREIRERQRERETLYLYTQLVLSPSMFANYHLSSSLLWLADFPVLLFVKAPTSWLISTTPHRCTTTPEGLLGPSGCRSRH